MDLSLFVLMLAATFTSGNSNMLCVYMFIRLTTADSGSVTATTDLSRPSFLEESHFGRRSWVRRKRSETMPCRRREQENLTGAQASCFDSGAMEMDGIFKETLNMHPSALRICTLRLPRGNFIAPSALL